MLKYCLRAYASDTRFLAQIVCPAEEMLETIDKLSKLDNGQATVKGFILDESEDKNDI